MLNSHKFMLNSQLLCPEYTRCRPRRDSEASDSNENLPRPRAHSTGTLANGFESPRCSVHVKDIQLTSLDDQQGVATDKFHRQLPNVTQK